MKTREEWARQLRKLGYDPTYADVLPEFPNSAAEARFLHDLTFLTAGGDLQELLDRRERMSIMNPTFTVTGEPQSTPCHLCSEPLWFDSSALGVHVSCRDAQAGSEIPPSPDPIPDSILIENDEFRREEEWEEYQYEQHERVDYMFPLGEHNDDWLK